MAQFILKPTKSWENDLVSNADLRKAMLAKLKTTIERRYSKGRYCKEG